MDTITGEIQLIEPISGTISIDINTNGNITIPEKVPIETYHGEYVVTPIANSSQILETKNKHLLDDITVLKVPYYQMSNQFGDTVYIASEVE